MTCLFIVCPIEQHHATCFDCVRLRVTKVGELDRVADVADWAEQALLKRAVVREQGVVKVGPDRNQKLLNDRAAPEMRKEPACVVERR